MLVLLWHQARLHIQEELIRMSMNSLLFYRESFVFVLSLGWNSNSINLRISQINRAIRGRAAPLAARNDSGWAMALICGHPLSAFGRRTAEPPSHCSKQPCRDVTLCLCAVCGTVCTQLAFCSFPRWLTGVSLSFVSFCGFSCPYLQLWRSSFISDQ